LAGGMAAILAALSFGVTAPLVARAAAGPLSTAALLYTGAAASSLVRVRRVRTGARFERRHALRLVAIALVGAGLAPTLLSWGLVRVGGTTGSLLLNMEGVFTVLLAWLCYREPIGKRVAAALTLMTCGGLVLSLGAAADTRFSALGALAVLGATLCWGIDNTLSQRLSQLDPLKIVGVKATLGASLTAATAVIAGDRWPRSPQLLVLLACGATGYGLSLRLYLVAQRRIGAARTGSIFALAPFVGAGFALLLGERGAGLSVAAASAFFAAGLWLHLTERHQHVHVHGAIDHDHPHRHDDGHHDHVHSPPFFGEHSHPHHHDRLEHEHDHLPDVHHDHAH